MRPGEKFFLSLVQNGTLSIDDEGRIWRHWWIHPFAGRIRLKKPKRAENAGRYLRLSTFKDGQSIKASAHRVVYIYFFGDVIDDLEIDHKDCNKHNNCPSNLEPVTQLENIKRATDNGLGRVKKNRKTPYPRGENAARAVLTWDDVREIRRLYKERVMTQQQLADNYGVKRANISAIIVGRSWKE